MGLDVLLNDLRVAWRNAIRRPAFTALVVATIALGVGVNSAVFALVDGVLLSPLPYREPSRLAFVWQTLPTHNVFELEPTPFDYEAWRRLAIFERVALVASDAYTLTAVSGDMLPERVRGSRVTASLASLLGIAPQLGRNFTDAEDDDRAAPAAILSDGLWKRRFAGDPRVIGQSIRINGGVHTIVGVMPAAGLLPGHLAASSDILLAARMSAAERANAMAHSYTVLARLRAGVSFASASAELDTFARQLASDRPESHTAVGARLTSVEELTVRGVRPALMVAAGGVALLLLVAGANVLTLLVARAANREHETAVRRALGATGQRLLSLAFADGAVYAALGGAAGLVIGTWSLKGLLPLFAASLPATASVGITTRVAVFTAALSILLAVVFAMVVAAQRPGRLVDALKASARTTTGGASVIRTRAMLVVGQVALAVVLLTSAGLMLNSVEKLAHVNPGFDAGHVLSFRLSLTGGPYEPRDRRGAFARELVARLTAIPGVAAAGITSQLPFGGTRGANGVEIEGQPVVRGQSIIIDQRHVTPSYFSAMKIPLLEGRTLSATDDERSEQVVVVNRTLAKRYWPNESAIDRRVRITAGFDAAHWLRIVGVVDDVRHVSLTREPVAEMYRPYSQAAVPAFAVVVRTDGDPAALTASAREVVRGMDAAMPLFDVRTMGDRVAASYAQARATMLLLVLVAVLAAALATVAVYGAIWYAVSLRIPEIGIRLALGATRGSICGAVIGRALTLASIGAAIGIAATAAATPVLKSMLFETRPIDPATFAVVLAGVFALTALASVLPALRAGRVDPAEALRHA